MKKYLPLFFLLIFFACDEAKPFLKIYTKADDNGKATYIEKKSNGRLEKIKVKDKPELIIFKTNVKSYGFSKKPSHLNINLEFDKPTAKKIAKITSEYLGQKLFVVFNKTLLLSPKIMGSITTGKIKLSMGHNNAKEFLKLKNILKK